MWQSITSSVIGTLLAWKLSPWRPKKIFNWNRVRELLGFGLNRTGFNLVNYFSRNFDNLLIGKYLGLAPLGYYNLAYKLLLFPINNISQVIAKVMFSSFSIIQDDKERIRRAYMKAIRYIALFTFPLMLGLSILAPEFVQLIYGPQWIRSIFVLRILSLVGMFQSISTLNGIIYQSQGRSDLQFRIGLIFALITCASFVVGLRWNIEGVTICYALTAAILLVPNFAIAFKLIELRLDHFLKQLLPIFGSNFLMAVSVILFRSWLAKTYHASDGISLISCVLFEAIVYLTFLFIFDKTLYSETLKLFQNFKSNVATVSKQSVVK